jgi:HK97 family phage prohead protease
MDSPETLTSGELVYRASEPASVHVVASKGDGDAIVVEGRMMPFDEWTEVRSSIEGHFMERFLPGSLSKTLAEQGHRVRALWEHGLDTVLGRQAIAAVDEMWEEADGAYFRSTLLEGLPKLLVSGIRKGLYGSSIRFRPIKYSRDPSPRRSEWNPQGIPEVTVREAFMKEFSITPFPQYAGATAGISIRSMTDEVAARQLLADPERLLEILRSTPTDSVLAEEELEPEELEPENDEPEAEEPEPETEDEPPHSPPTDDVGSRSTRPVRNYLQKEPRWQRL